MRMISEVAEEEREALDAKVVEKSTESIVIETCILRATLSTLNIAKGTTDPRVEFILAK